jgi:hypothetical protein
MSFRRAGLDCVRGARRNLNHHAPRTMHGDYARRLRFLAIARNDIHFLFFCHLERAERAVKWLRGENLIVLHGGLCMAVRHSV